jgi:hypothetical protein
MICARWSVLGLAFAAGLSVVACAAAPRPRAEAPPARVKDSRPDRIAAQRSAAPASLELEESDERWGIEGARERREAEKQKKPPAPPPRGSQSTVIPAPPP